MLRKANRGVVPTKKSVPIEALEFMRLRCAGCQSHVYHLACLLFSVPDCFRTRTALQAKILALRRQILILQRSRGHKLHLIPADRALCGLVLSRLSIGWRSALIMVKRETVMGENHKNKQKPERDRRFVKRQPGSEFGKCLPRRNHPGRILTLSG